MKLFHISLYAAISLFSSAVIPAKQPSNDSKRAAIRESYGRLPLYFEANEGQKDAKVKFSARTGGSMLFLTSREATWRYRANQTSGGALRMKLVGSNPAARVQGLDRLEGHTNYFIGNDSAKWRTNVPQYGKVQYQNIYPGVDLIYHGTQRQLEYDFVVSPGADPKRITLQFDGAERLELDGNGELVLHTAAGEFRQKKTRDLSADR